MIFQEAEDFFVHHSHPLAKMSFGQGKEAPLVGSKRWTMNNELFIVYRRHRSGKTGIFTLTFGSNASIL